jgi:hypothetical protein
MILLKASTIIPILTTINLNSLEKFYLFKKGYLISWLKLFNNV